MGVLHEHSWRRVGCWQDRGGIGRLMPLPIWRGDWLEYIRTLSRADLEELMVRDLNDPLVWSEVEGDFEAWRAESTEHGSANGESL